MCSGVSHWHCSLQVYDIFLSVFFKFQLNLRGSDFVFFPFGLNQPNQLFVIFGGKKSA